MFKNLFDLAKEIVIESPARLTVVILASIIGTQLREASPLMKVSYVMAAGIVGGGAGIVDATLKA